MKNFCKMGIGEWVIYDDGSCWYWQEQGDGSAIETMVPMGCLPVIDEVEL